MEFVHECVSKKISSLSKCYVLGSFNMGQPIRGKDVYYSITKLACLLFRNNAYDIPRTKKKRKKKGGRRSIRASASGYPSRSTSTTRKWFHMMDRDSVILGFENGDSSITLNNHSMNRKSLVYRA